MTPLPGFVTGVLNTLAATGYPAYAVGGCVRDILLGREPHDWDVATAAPASIVSALFERTVPTGIKYGTVTVLTPGGAVEVTTFRRDGAYHDSRRPDSVDFVSGLEEDLKRRDFTINALAMDASGALTDLFDGRGDLKKRVIRCVGDPEKRFSEDALRMLRAIRFSAQLDFTVDPAAMRALARLSPLASRLSAERVRDELVKTLSSPRPELSSLMIEYGLLDRFISKNGKIFPSDILRAAPAGLRVPVFALLCHTTSPAGLLTALRFPSKLIKLASAAEALMDTLTPDPPALRRALAVKPPDPVLLASAALGFYERAKAELDAGDFTRPGDLAVTASDLISHGVPAPQLRQTLRALSLAVTSGDLQNTPEALLNALNR